MAADRARTWALGGQNLRAPALTPGLFLVATPIGHLGDITLRALETLAAADLIACEDTRVTRTLLDRYAISAPLTPYHEHNAAAARPKIMAGVGPRLQTGPRSFGRGCVGNRHPGRIFGPCRPDGGRPADGPVLL
jgi:hypothetical protein